MDTALDDVAFLANSENRVTVLETLTEAPGTRDEIRDQVDASRVTVSRILRELETRNWIERSEREYVATPLGEWMCDEFTRLVDEMEAGHRLREPLQWLPADLMTFDVQCLRNTEIILLDGSDPTAIARWIAEFHRPADRIRGVVREAAPVFVDNQWELTVQGNTRLELVISPEARDVILKHPPSARRFHEMLNEENVRFFISDDIPISVRIVNGVVGINLTDEQGVLRGGLKTENKTVHEWAVDLFRSCREKARLVEPEAITA